MVIIECHGNDDSVQENRINFPTQRGQLPVKCY